MSAVTDILRKARKIPAMPAAVARLFAMAQDDRSNSLDFERVLKADVALSANLLRLANSPIVGRASKVTDVRTAVTVLGIRRVCEMAASAHLLRVISQPLIGYDMSAQAFWTHCSAVGLLSEALAKELRLQHVGMAFTCGLLHDIGKLAIALACEETQVELRVSFDANAEQFIEAERKAFATDHVEVGEALAQRWRLPEPVILAVRWHHLPDACPSEEARQAADVVHVADAMSHALGFGTDAGGLARALSSDSCERLGVTVQRLELVASDSMAAIQAAAEVFNPGGGSK